MNKEYKPPYYPVIPAEGEYVAVDKEAEVTDNDYFCIIGGHPQNHGIRKCHWRALDQQGWDEISKSWTKKCNILYLQERGGKGAGFCYSHEVWKIIAHTGVPSLKDSELPLIAIPSIAESLAKQTYGDMSSDYGNNRAIIGFQTGYKAAGGYTKDDMRKALTMKNMGYGTEHILQSLKKHPVAVKLKMRTVKDPDNGNPAFGGYDVSDREYLVIENNQVLVEEVIYERNN